MHYSAPDAGSAITDAAVSWTAPLIPEASLGNCRIEHFTVSEERSRFDQLRSIGRGGRHVPPGRYARLVRGGTTIMSNTPSEIRDLGEFRWRVTGDVLNQRSGLRHRRPNRIGESRGVHGYSYRDFGRRHRAGGAGVGDWPEL